MADYYCCSYEQAIKALLPGAVRRGTSNRGKRRFVLGEQSKVDEYFHANSNKKSAAKRLSVLQLLTREENLTAEEITQSCGAGASVVKALLDEELIAVDLPGAYSMSPFTSEESITSSYVKNENPDVIINIVDATNLSRSFCHS